MRKNAECEHPGLMGQPVLETRKFAWIVVRIRLCEQCGDRVRTEEILERQRVDERESAKLAVEGLKQELWKEIQLRSVVMDALRVLKAAIEKEVDG